MVSATRVAVVESPFQAMALQEAVVAGAIRLPDAVIVRGAGDPIDGVLALGDPALRDVATRCSKRTAFAMLARAREVVIGDVFSALAQVALSARRGGRVVLLEDGAAAVRAWSILAGAPGPLARAHGRRPIPRAVGHVAARRLRGLARRGAVSIVAGLPMDDETAAHLGAAVVRHDFAWARSVAVEPNATTEVVARTPHVVVGSALAADGHVDRAFYEDWLRACFESGPSVFLPHRRDEPWTAELARSSGAVLGDHVLPVELELRDVHGELVVDSLPTTAVLTVPVVRGSRSTVVRTAAPPPGVWSSRTPAAMIELVGDIARLSASSQH